jgi:hypothetical protein
VTGDRFYLEQGPAGLHPSLPLPHNVRPYVVAAIERGTDRGLYSEWIPVDAGSIARGENLTEWVEIMDLVARVRLAAELKLETESEMR